MNIFLPLMVATLAPITNVIQMIPQLYKTYTTKSAKDISLYSISIILVNAMLWQCTDISIQLHEFLRHSFRE